MQKQHAELAVQAPPHGIASAAINETAAEATAEATADAAHAPVQCRNKTS